MCFNTEKITKGIFLIRGYKKQNDNNYVLVMTLVNDGTDNYEIKGFLTQNPLGVGEFRQLVKYLKSIGIKMFANVINEDFKRFYGTKQFKRVKLIE